MLRVGLTGGIGSGKTTASDIFQNSYNIPVIDADEISRDLLHQGTTAYDEVINLFGQECLLDNKEINRAYLREQIFSQANKRQQLQDIIHPKVQHAIVQRSAELSDCYCLIVIPLLIEANMQSLVDRILVIDTDKSIQLERIVSRDQCTFDQAEVILSTQITPQERLEHADDILRNNGSLADLSDQIFQFHQKYLAICA